MNKSTQHPNPNGIIQSSGDSSRSEPRLSGLLAAPAFHRLSLGLAGLVCLLLAAPAARADRSPTNCAGSALEISLYTSIPDVHIGDTLYYSANVFNGVPNSGRVACDASSIQAWIVTPDLKSNYITVVRTELTQGEADYYADVVSYVVRAQDIQPNGTLLASATDTGIIHQNIVNGIGGSSQEVNTEVNIPCVHLAAQCVGGVGQFGAITFTGTVTNCGNDTLVNLTVTNFDNNQIFTVFFPTNLAPGQAASFSGSWVPMNPCGPNQAILTVIASDEFTSTPIWLTNSATINCQNTLTPGIAVTKSCPAAPVSPGQLLTFSGSVSNTGNVTLTNIVVVNNQPAPHTTVFTLASLAPGAVSDFTASYTAPASCSVADTLTASAASVCGVAVSNSVSATCPIVTTPLIAITQNCPVNPPVPGGLLTYSGTVSNAGNITLTNVVVLNNLSGATPVFTAATMAPGAVSSFTGSYLAPTNCSSTSASTATARSICGVAVTNTASATCPITTTPILIVTQICPATAAIPGGLVTYSGTIRNAGNITLTNVVVLNNLSGAAPVFTAATLSPGAGAIFTGSYVAPAACFATSTSTATGTSVCGVAVTNAASTTCPIATTPLLVVTQTCPANAPAPGGLLTYSGTVSNAGNIMLTNVVVLNNQSGATPVFTAATLAPGAGASFTGSYLAPANCASASTSTATGESICGVAVTNAVTVTCPIGTTPQIVVTQNCPANAVSPGGLLTYGGTVSNAGNITLTNVVVMNNLSGATPVFTAAAMAPGAAANFTGSYLAPANCSSTSTSTATGESICGVAVTNAVSTACPITTTPLIAVTQNCPVIPPIAGNLLTYTGTVSNPGNITLTNVVVMNNLSGSTPVFTAATLAPGASANFTGSYVAPTNCSSTSTSTATGESICGVVVANAVTETCPIITIPSIAITLNCPAAPVSPGGLLTYRGTVSNPGNIMLTNVVVLNNQSGTTPVFTAATLAPGAVSNYTGSYHAPASGYAISTSTVRATSICNEAVSNSASSSCPITTSPGIAVTKSCPPQPVTPGGTLVFTGTVTNTGNIILTNVFVVDNQPAANTRVLGPITLAVGKGTNFSGSYIVPLNACASSDTLTVTANDNSNGAKVTNTVSVTCPILTIPGIAITQNCPVNPAVPGGLLTYSGTVSNAGNVTLTNVVVLNNQSGATPVFTAAALAPGAVSSFSGSYLAPTNCSSTSTSTATGESICGIAVANAVTVTCPVGTAPLLALTQNCPVNPAIPGGPLTYSGTVSNAGNITITNVVVLNNLSGTTPVFTAAAMAPGAVSNFTGSYLAPASCYSTSTSTATGRSTCGVAVTNTVSATCPISTTPLLAVTQNCSANAPAPGGLVTYSGTVSNAGNVMLTNVVVLNNQSGPMPVFTAATLAPGAAANFTGSYQAPANCSSTSTSTATGESICGVAVTNAASTTCPITTTPVLVITQNCPANPANPGGVLTYSGMVSNAGNIELTNVVVLNNLSGTTPVFTASAMAPGAAANFTGSYLAPTNCSSTSTSTATGTSICGISVTNAVTMTCPIGTTPLLVVTEACPVNPAIPGGPLIYSGTVSNAGNVTLTNVVVLNNLSGATPVFTAATMAPGAVSSFTGSYLAPDNCSSASTLTATGRSTCGFAVTNTASATCPILTAPAIVVTQTCPNAEVLQGGLLTYSGTVSNAGNITLTNIVVVDNRPASNTVVFTLAALPPGATASFTGSYTVPLDCCVVWSTLDASGQDCAGVTVTDTATATCTVLTLPQIVVTKICAPGLLVPGDLLTYSGIVSNAGNITLVNVTVVNSQYPATWLLGPIDMAPGEWHTYTASYIVPPDFCGADTVTASGLNVCTLLPVVDSVTAACPVMTPPPGIAITKNCPPMPTVRGGLYTYTGSVSNSGKVTLINVVVTDDEPSNNTPVLGPITLAPGVSVNFTNSYTAPACCCLIFDTLTVTGQDHCTGSNVTATATEVCPLLYTPGIAVVPDCPPNPIPMGSVYAFSGFVTNTGDAVLTNVFVFGPEGTNMPVLGPIDLAPGEMEFYFGSYTVPSNICSVSVAASGQAICNGSVFTNTASCPVATTPLLALTQNCPAIAAIPGGLVTYSGTVSNAGNITLLNVVVLNNLSGATPVFTAATLAPGAVSSFTGSYLAPASCSATSTSTATGESICGAAVTNAVSTACPITTMPLLALTQACPVASPIPGGLLTYSGTVSNAGNIMLTNVVVLNNLSGATPVFTAATLAPGAVSNFSGSYPAPTNCSSTSTSTATGTSVCGVSVTNAASTTCPILIIPAIAITQDCPPTPASPNGLLTYSGTVSNSGVITLINVVVLNNQSGTTPVLTVATLAPGVSANFTGSYTAPASGYATSSSTVSATSLCGVAVTNSASSSCPILTSPGIEVTKACPPVPVVAGGVLVFTGTVTNTGNTTLTNIMVVDDQLAANTPVLGPITLAPGAGTNFSGHYPVLLNACDSSDTLTVTGNDSSTGIALTNTVSVTCPVISTPAISITETCPPGPVSAGSPVVFGGLVSNPGDITLTNVLVFSSQGSNGNPLLGPITLVPGAAAPFSGSYIATGGSNPTTNSAIVTNSSGVITTNTVSVIVTNNTVTVTTSAITPTFGTIDPVSGALTDRFNIPANLHALMYADQNENWGPTLFYSTRQPASGADTFDSISTISSPTYVGSPYAGFVTNEYNLSYNNYDALTLAAPDVGYGAVNFYYIRHDNSGVGHFGVIKAAGATSDSDLPAPLSGTGYTGLAFAAANVGNGANMFYYVRNDATTGLSMFGTINPTPGLVETDLYSVGTNFDALVFVPGAVSTWGTGIFAYLRHTSTGSIIGTINPVTDDVTDRISLGTNFLNAVTFAATDVGYGPNLFYYLRPAGSVSTTNSVTTYTTNTVITLITNTTTTYTTNSVVTFIPTNNVSASGMDICQARTVAAAANCAGPLGPAVVEPEFRASAMAVSSGLFRLSFPSQGGMSYTVQYKNALTDPAWTDLETVVGTGASLSITDPGAAERPTRFYRIISRP